ncbi:hypothetical protein [Blastococcus brunescens]|uniref:Uncharacterized protein n=1 Tax=Blastococcus brunescens TaxID=1564165 RepID=A0ABZ1B756_9ACTN|nr:hypothetical protein [Blastococcus sp. BMG 8361]WRL65506.1 hypothetical protein U6N30_07880 [Blastococcus sp. BMG 8361]
MTAIRYADREPHPLTVTHREARPQSVTGPDRPLELDPDPGRWPHPRP